MHVQYDASALLPLLLAGREIEAFVACYALNATTCQGTWVANHCDML